MRLQPEQIVSHIDFLISELKHLKQKMTIEEGIHFNVLLTSDSICIEQWDTDADEPRLLSYITKIKEEDYKNVINQEAMKALNTLGIRAHKKQIYWNSDLSWNDLPENFKKLNMIYKIKEDMVSSELRMELLERINALYNMSEQS